jgi:Xaa-Pro aminopeptidase
MTELEAWSEMMHAMAAAGGEPAALHELAVIGTFGTGHSISSRRQLQPGDWLHVDPCGVFERYHANRSGLYFLGEPPQEAVELMSVLAGAFDVLCGVARGGTPVAEVTTALREYYVEHGIWDLKGNTWVGGYELGASFPPDWVGEWLFTVNDDAPEGVFEAGMVTNFESIIGLGLLDTLIYESDGARTLSKVPYDIVAVPC